MDIPLCHTSQIILTNEAALPLYRQSPERFAGALAPGREVLPAWAAQLSPLPVGLALDCPPMPAETGRPEQPRTLWYMERCKESFRGRLHDRAAFYYVRSAPCFAALRAAVLALSDLCGRTLIAELAVEGEDALLPDGTELRAAVGVLQRIGVTTVILTAHYPEALSGALEAAAPYARLSLGVCAPSAWLRAQTPLYNTEFCLTAPHDSEAALLAAIGECETLLSLPRDHDDFILAPDGKNAHFIDPTIDISDEIECGHRLEQALLDAEDDAGALKLVLESEEDLLALEEHCYMISRPVCLCAEPAELLEQGLRIYPGLALYDGTWEQSEEVLRYLEQKYGLIRL